MFWHLVRSWSARKGRSNRLAIAPQKMPICVLCIICKTFWSSSGCVPVLTIPAESCFDGNEDFDIGLLPYLIQVAEDLPLGVNRYSDSRKRCRSRSYVPKRISMFARGRLLCYSSASFSHLHRHHYYLPAWTSSESPFSRKRLLLV